MPRPSNKSDIRKGRRPDVALSKISSTHPPKSSPLYYKALKFTVLPANLCLQFFCAVTISQYDPAHANRELGKLGRHLCRKNINTGSQGINRVLDSTVRENWFSPMSNGRLFIHIMPLPNFLCDPSSSTFVNVSMIHVFAVLVFYNTRRGDQYQDYFVAVGLLCGIVAGIIASSTHPLLEAMKDCVPISITLGLMASWIGHLILSGFRSHSRNV